MRSRLEDSEQMPERFFVKLSCTRFCTIIAVSSASLPSCSTRERGVDLGGAEGAAGGPTEAFTQARAHQSHEIGDFWAWEMVRA